MKRLFVFAFLLVLFLAPALENKADEAEEALARCDNAIAIFTSYEEAASSAKTIGDLGVQRNDTELEARGLIRMVFVDLQFAQWSSPPRWRERAVELVCRLPNSNLAKAEVQMFTGFMDAFYGNDHAHGIAALHEAAAIATTLEDDRLLAQVYLFLGKVLPYQGRDDYATECLNRSASFAHHGGFVYWEFVALRHLLDLETFHPAIESPSQEKIARINELAKLLKVQTRWSLTQDERIAFDKEIVEETYPLIQANCLTESPLNAIKCQITAWRLVAHFQKVDQWEDSVRYMNIADHACSHLKDESTHMAIFAHRACYHGHKGEFDKVKELLPRYVSHRKKQMRFGELSFFFNKLAGYAFRRDEHELAHKWSEMSQDFHSKVGLADQARLASDNFVQNTLNSRQLRRELKDELLARDLNIAQQNFWIILFSLFTPLLFIGSWIWHRSQKMQAEKKRLSRLVNEQTELLQVAKNNAEKANQAKTDFLARVNHELRNPLTALVCNCELIELEANKSPKIQQATDTIRACTQSLLDVIEDVLDFTRIESGQLTLKENNFSPKQIAQTVESIVSGNLNRNVELKFDFENDLPNTVRGDEPKLRQVLVNLGVNAAKNTDEGLINYDWKWDQSKSQLIVEVSDTGCGIHERDQSTIFNQYATKTTKPGRGLGLFISKAFIERMGGRISLESIVGVGSRFKIEVPLNIITSPPKRNVPMANKVDSVNRILVIDDEEINLTSIELLLNARAGNQVFTANNWQSAKEILAREVIDFAFIDLRMPNHDGYEVATRIKNLELRCSPLMIAITGDATEVTRAKTEQFGFHGFLAKPFSLRSLEVVLEQMQKRKTSMHEESGTCS